MHHRRAIRLVLASTILPACYSPHDQATTGESGDDASADTTFDASGSSSTAGPTTGATMSATSASSTTDMDTSTGAGDPVCGDAMVEGEEVCDDGLNDGSYGGCEPDCMSLGPHCGDAVPQGDEMCDDGDDINGNGCNIDCIESGTVLWTRTLDEGVFYRIATNDMDDLLALGGGALASTSAVLVDLDVDGNDNWTDTYAYPSASTTYATAIGVHEMHDWLVGGRANVPGQSFNGWWRDYSDAGAPGTTTFYDNPGSTFDQVSEVAFDGAGNLFVFGGSLRDDLGQDADLWLRKFDVAGDELWTQSFDSGADDRPAAMAIGVDDYVVVTANLEEGDGKIGWLRKYGPEGNTIWTYSLGVGGYYDQIFDVAIAPDLSIAIAAEVDFAASLLKFTDDGDPDWGVTHDGGYDCVSKTCLYASEAHGVAFDSTGAVIIVGHQQSSMWGDDIWVAKYGADGEELWSDVIPAADPTNSAEHTAWDVAITSTDDIVVVGAWDENGIGGEVLQWIQKYAP